MTSTLCRRRPARVLLAATALVAAVAAYVQPASANVCQTCDDDPPPPPGPAPARYVVEPAQGVPGYTLSGYQAEDSTGYDELYLKINGAKVWGIQTIGAGPFPVPGNGYYNIGFEYAFYTGLTQSPSVYVSLFDDDWPDADDKLGGHQVTFAPFPVGHTRFAQLMFTEDGARYGLQLQIRRLS